MLDDALRSRLEALNRGPLPDSGRPRRWRRRLADLRLGKAATSSRPSLARNGCSRCRACCGGVKLSKRSAGEHLRIRVAAGCALARRDEAGCGAAGVFAVATARGGQRGDRANRRYGRGFRGTRRRAARSGDRPGSGNLRPGRLGVVPRRPVAADRGRRRPSNCCWLATMPKKRRCSSRSGRRSPSTTCWSRSTARRSTGRWCWIAAHRSPVWHAAKA